MRLDCRTRRGPTIGRALSAQLRLLASELRFVDVYAPRLFLWLRRLALQVWHAADLAQGLKRGSGS